MALQSFKNAVRFNSTTYGSGTFGVGTAPTGYVAPESAGVTDGKTYRYYAQSPDGTQFEMGNGVYSVISHTLTRVTIEFTSNNDTNAVNFTVAPIVDVFASVAPTLEPPYIRFDATQTLTTAQKKQAQVNGFVAPTTQTLTSLSVSPYVPPPSCLWIEAFFVGGGGGGSGVTNAGGLVAGDNGGSTTFNGVVAAGGTGAPSNSAGGAGGTGGSGSATRRAPGGPGQGVILSQATLGSTSGNGGDSYFGGGAVGVPSGTFGGNSANSPGGGGSGAVGGTTTFIIGSGGGAGEFVYLLLASPPASIAFAIGAAGLGGVSNENGGDGAPGVIFIIEHYS